MFFWLRTGVLNKPSTLVVTLALPRRSRLQHSALAKLREMQTSLGKDQLKLKQDVPTRWNSTFDMLERLLKNKEPLDSTLALLGYKDQLEELEWTELAHAV